MVRFLSDYSETLTAANRPSSGLCRRLARGTRSRRVIPTRSPGVTAANAAESFASAASRAVFSDRQDKVFTAAGIKATGSRQHRPKARLIKPHAADQEGRQARTEDSSQRAHHDLTSLANFRAIWRT